MKAPPSPNDLVDSVLVDKDHPRHPFSYTLQPWKVLKNIEGKIIEGCHADVNGEQALTLLIVVKSATSYRKRRDAVRSTWGSISYLGGIRIVVAFIVGNGGTMWEQQSLRRENEKYGDVIQFDGPDDYWHIALKVLAGMQWSLENLPPSSLYASADDDFMVDIAGICDKLQTIMRTDFNLNTWLALAPIYCVYKYEKSTLTPIRTRYTKYYTSPQEFERGKWPPSCLGGWYVMSRNYVEKLYEASKTKLALRMDDVWITGVLRESLDANSQAISVFEDEESEKPFVEHLGTESGVHADVVSELREKWRQYGLKLTGREFCTS